MSEFWSWYVIAIVVINIVGCILLLHFTRKKKQKGTASDTTGHIYDGIEEYDNPMPRWWLWMFYLTIVFGVVYLVLYPGMGNFKGTLGWTQNNQYQEEVAEADEKYFPLYQKYAAISIEKLQNEPQALQMGQSIFANTCFGCHGADARGSLGFPNLTDNEWLYGSDPKTIKASILNGRNGTMPGWSETLTEREIDSVSNYISSKSEHGRVFVKELVSQGEEVFNKYCLACHGQDLKGNETLGAANLVDDVWLHGASPGLVKDVIKYGRINNMPAHANIIGSEKAHLVAAYVYSLSKSKEQN